MRTTLTLADEVYEAARRLAFEQRRPLGDVVSDLVAKGLQAEDGSRGKRTLGFWSGQGSITDDFNETPPEVSDAVNSTL